MTFIDSRFFDGDDVAHEKLWKEAGGEDQIRLTSGI
jgi:hypothetical protein